MGHCFSHDDDANTVCTFAPSAAYPDSVSPPRAVTGRSGFCDAYLHINCRIPANVSLSSRPSAESFVGKNENRLPGPGRTKRVIDFLIRTPCARPALVSRPAFSRHRRRRRRSFLRARRLRVWYTARTAILSVCRQRVVREYGWWGRMNRLCHL